MILKKKEDFKKKSFSELNELKKKLKEKDKELKDLKEENSKLKETENSLNELLKQKDKKNEELINTLNKCKEESKKIAQQINAAEENILLKNRLKEYEYREFYKKQSSFVLQTLGIKDLVWRTGNAYEDMENEQILLKMAEILKIVPDIKQYKNLMENYTFNQVQSDYLNKFLILSNLIDFQLKQLPEEKMVEILKVRFKDSKFDKTKLAAKLQTDAIKGISFFDISQSYPEDVEYSEIPHEVLQDSLKKKIQQLQNGQVGVIWSEEGYLIIKKRMKKLSYNPFREIRPEITEKIKNQVRLWIDEYRSITKD